MLALFAAGGTQEHDLLVLDWSLPDMTGGELIARLLAAGHVLPEVTIVVSASDPALLRQENIPPGVADVVQKPLFPEALRKLCQGATKAGGRPADILPQALPGRAAVLDGGASCWSRITTSTGRLPASCSTAGGRGSMSR